MNIEENLNDENLIEEETDYSYDYDDEDDYYDDEDYDDYDYDVCDACGSHRCSICGEMTCFGCSCEDEKEEEFNDYEEE